MKIVIISDTHGRHRALQLPEGDMIIHAGDVTSRGLRHEVLDFLDWFSGLDYEHKIFIAGNHDFYFEKEGQQEISEIIPSNIIYLNDSGVEIEGLNIWGSPVQPWFFDWAFNRQRGADIQKHWDLIPAHTDILITHGPAFGILDRTTRNELVGCKDLLDRIREVNPQVHISGHIHEGYGMMELDGTKFINASVVNVNYKLVNAPVEVELQAKTAGTW